MISISEITKLAVKSLLRNKSRSLLTMLGIIIGVSAVILLVSIGQGLQTFITKQFESLGANVVMVMPGKFGSGGNFASSANSFMVSKLSLNDVDKISRLGPPVGAVAASLESSASISYAGKSKYVNVGGYSASYLKIMNLSASKGVMYTDADDRASKNVVVLGESLVTKLFGSMNPVGKSVTIGSQKFRVIGVLNKFGASGFGLDVNEFVAMPLTTAQKLLGTKSIQSIGVQARDKNSVSTVISMVKKELGKRLKEDEFSVIDSANLIQTINQVLSVLTLALGGIAAISLLVGGVGIMNIMLVSVTERTREIGLRKAVGAKPTDILYQFLIEAVVLSLGGGFIGVMIGSLGALAMSSFIETTVTWWSILLSFGVSAMVGIIFGVAPAARASKLNPIEALKYE
jgi:putative ABC transport system permease protein